MGYMTNFIVYVFAMMGVIMLALFVFKHATGCRVNSKGANKSLRVLDTLNLTPRKTLYVVSAGKEKFLIAGDSERTTLISKLRMAPLRQLQVTGRWILKTQEPLFPNCRPAHILLRKT